MHSGSVILYYYFQSINGDRDSVHMQGDTSNPLILSPFTRFIDNYILSPLISGQSDNIEYHHLQSSTVK